MIDLLFDTVRMFVISLVLVLAVATAGATLLEWHEQRRAERELLRSFGIEPARRRLVVRRARTLRDR